MAKATRVGGLVFLDRLDGRWCALGLAQHRDQAGPRQHHIGELVHAGAAQFGAIAMGLEAAWVVVDAIPRSS